MGHETEWTNTGDCKVMQKDGQGECSLSMYTLNTDLIFSFLFCKRDISTSMA